MSDVKQHWEIANEIKAKSLEYAKEKKKNMKIEINVNPEKDDVRMKVTVNV